MNGIKHELVGPAAAAAAAAAAYPNSLLYGPTPSWMTGENFPGKKRRTSSVFLSERLLLLSVFFLSNGYCLILSVGRACARTRYSVRHQNGCSPFKRFLIYSLT